VPNLLPTLPKRHKIYTAGDVVFNKKGHLLFGRCPFFMHID
jgi:hypothetical protein